MKYLHKPFPENHYLITVPLANQVLEFAFDTLEEATEYYKKIPACSLKGAEAFEVKGGLRTKIDASDCATTCRLQHVPGCDAVRRKLAEIPAN